MHQMQVNIQDSRRSRFLSYDMGFPYLLEKRLWGSYHRFRHT
jgi:hypothetical protein